MILFFPTATPAPSDGRAGSDPVLSEPQASELTGLSRRTLQRFRLEGGGPAFIRLSTTRVGYRQSVVDAWLSSRTYATTSAETAAAGREARS